MRLVELYIENVFSILNASVSLDQTGLVLITGYSIDDNTANGAGKSSLINKSLIWGLFGQTAGGLKGDEVINRHITKAKALVRVSFEGNDKKPYVIERTRNPNGLKLIQNGTDISRKLEKDTQALIEIALGRSFETFIQTDFFGQGRPSSYLSLTPKEQKDVLENILSLDKLSLWAEKARELKGEAADKINKAQLELAGLNGQKKNTQFYLEQIQKKNNEWLAAFQKSLQDFNDLKIKENNLNSELDNTILAIKVKRAEYNNLINTTIADAKAKVLQWQQYKNKLDQISDTCPVCGNQVNKQHILTEQKLANIKLTSAAQTLFELDTIRSSCSFDLSSLLENETLLKGELDRLNSYRTLFKQNPYTAQLVELESSLGALDPKIKTIQDNIAILNSRVEAFNTWSNIFSKNFYAYVLSKACPFLEQRTAKHLEGLNNSQLKVKFQTVKELKSGETKDEFNIGVSSKTGGIGFDSLSGGEQQLVSFATGMALSDLAETQLEGKSNLLVLDEPFVELDKRNQESVIDYVHNELLKHKSSIFIISNDEHLKSLISKRIHVTKEHGISKVELHV